MTHKMNPYPPSRLSATPTSASFRRPADLRDGFLDAVRGLSWLGPLLTNPSFYLGLVEAFQTLPVLLFSSLGEVVADHTSKRRLLFLTQAALLLLALALGLRWSGRLSRFGICASSSFSRDGDGL